MMIEFNKEEIEALLSALYFNNEWCHLPEISDDLINRLEEAKKAMQ